MDAVGTPAKRSGVTAGPNTISDSSARNSRRYQPLVTVTLAVAAGIVWDRYAPRQAATDAVDSAHGIDWFAVWWCLCAGCLVLWWVVWRRRRDGPAGWILLAAAVLAGSAWHEANWFLFDRHEIARYADFEPAPVCIEAVARESPERVSAPGSTPLRAIPVGERSRLVVDVERIRDGGQWHRASGACQLSVEGHLLGVHQGDHLRVFGQFARTAPPLNPGEFDFAAHARADRQLARIRSSAPECVAILADGSVWNFAHLLDALRVRAKQLVRTLVGPNRAGLAAAILLGAREGLPYEETESYLVTGTIHVLVVSGMNVAILATGLLALMRLGWLSRRAVLLG